MILVQRPRASAGFASGDLVRSFGAGGRLFSDLRQGSHATSLAASGRKIVVAGPAPNGEGVNPATFVRYRPNGKIDRSFGDRGVSRIPLCAVQAMSVQEGGAMLAAGACTGSDGSSGLATMRLNPDGSLDKSFGDGGIAIAGPVFGNPTARADGKIYLGGYARSDRLKSREAVDYAIARLKANGEIDRSFSGDGRTTTNMRPGGNKRHTDEAFGVAVTSNGDPVLAGDSNRKRDYGTKVALAKYHGSARR